MKVAIYARYSSDNQRDASIADQLRMCRLHAEKQGWHVIEEYTDHAISGASLIRPGIQALMTDAMAGRFDPVTPVAGSQRVADALGIDLLLFPDVGHGAVSSNDCALDLWIAFMDEPSEYPDTSCMDDIEPITFG